MYYNLGNILQELRELQKAKNCYEKLLYLDPSYKKGYSGYGNLLLKTIASKNCYKRASYGNF